MSGSSGPGGCVAVAGSAWRTAAAVPGARRDGRGGTAWAGCARGGGGCAATPVGARCGHAPERRSPGPDARRRRASRAFLRRPWRVLVALENVPVQCLRAGPRRGIELLPQRRAQALVLAER